MPHQLTRRQLIKALGLSAAGVSLTGLATGASKAQDAAVAAPIPHRYWWVQSVDTPTTEIDWNVYQRFSEWRTVRGSLPEYRGSEVHQRYQELQAVNLAKFEREAVPGYTTKDMALQAAVGTGNPGYKFMGPQQAQRPEDRGMPRYTGSPEDNAGILTAAMRHMGASTIGFVELDPATTRKFIYQEEPNPGRQRIDFENVDIGFEDADNKRLVIPDKARWAVVFSIQMSNETMKYGPTVLGSLTTSLTYTRLATVITQTHEFLRGLGYQSYSATTTNGLAVTPALAVHAGLGEMSRLNRLVTPEFGPMARLGVLITDLPLAPTKPIRFGVMDFCKTCMSCAEACPSGALSQDAEPSWDVRGPWSNPGHKAYFEDSVLCRNQWNECGTNCGICFMACPFAVDDDASLHRIVKGIVANTTFFNGLFTYASTLSFPVPFNAPMKNPEDWWRNANLAEMGIDTRRGGRNI